MKLLQLLKKLFTGNKNTVKEAVSVENSTQQKSAYLVDSIMPRNKRVIVELVDSTNSTISGIYAGKKLYADVIEGGWLRLTPVKHGTRPFEIKPLEIEDFNVAGDLILAKKAGRLPLAGKFNTNNSQHEFRLIDVIEFV